MGHQAPAHRDRGRPRAHAAAALCCHPRGPAPPLGLLASQAHGHGHPRPSRPDRPQGLTEEGQV
eukprot:8109724-Lingulodinium_polyedra.AAC.1